MFINILCNTEIPIFSSAWCRCWNYRVEVIYLLANNKATKTGAPMAETWKMAI